MNLVCERRSVCRQRDLTRIPGKISLPCGGRASATRFVSVRRRGSLRLAHTVTVTVDVTVAFAVAVDVTVAFAVAVAHVAHHPTRRPS